MTLSIRSSARGPMGNNVYLLADQATRQAVLIDPSFDSERILKTVQDEGLELGQIWLTHAHFDHIAGIGPLFETLGHKLTVGLHPADLELYRSGGGAANFGLFLDPGPQPSLFFEDGQILQIGETALEVRHTPGHTPGHVIFYQPEAGAAFVGDVIFRDGVGRTDLPGGSWPELLNSITSKILTLPAETRLLSGHGPETTVEHETRSNPFLQDE